MNAMAKWSEHIDVGQTLLVLIFVVGGVMLVLGVWWFLLRPRPVLNLEELKELEQAGDPPAARLAAPIAPPLVAAPPARDEQHDEGTAGEQHRTPVPPASAPPAGGGDVLVIEESQPARPDSTREVRQAVDALDVVLGRMAGRPEAAQVVPMLQEERAAVLAAFGARKLVQQTTAPPSLLADATSSSSPPTAASRAPESATSATRAFSPPAVGAASPASRASALRAAVTGDIGDSSNEAAASSSHRRPLTSDPQAATQPCLQAIELLEPPEAAPPLHGGPSTTAHSAIQAQPADGAASSRQRPTPGAVRVQQPVLDGAAAMGTMMVPSTAASGGSPSRHELIGLGGPGDDDATTDARGQAAPAARPVPSETAGGAKADDPALLWERIRQTECLGDDLLVPGVIDEGAARGVREELLELPKLTSRALQLEAERLQGRGDRS